MPSTMSRMQWLAGRPPRPASQAGSGSIGSKAAHSASVMSDGQARRRVRRDMPPGQHRHATPGRAVAAPGWTAADGARYNDTRGSWDRDGSDNLAITRSLCGHIDDTPRQAWEDPEALRPTASEGF